MRDMQVLHGGLTRTCMQIPASLRPHASPNTASLLLGKTAVQGAGLGGETFPTSAALAPPGAGGCKGVLIPRANPPPSFPRFLIILFLSQGMRIDAALLMLW